MKTITLDDDEAALLCALLTHNVKVEGDKVRDAQWKTHALLLENVLSQVMLVARLPEGWFDRVFSEIKNT
jgi:hypothetical protein